MNRTELLCFGLNSCIFMVFLGHLVYLGESWRKASQQLISNSATYSLPCLFKESVRTFPSLCSLTLPHFIAPGQPESDSNPYCALRFSHSHSHVLDDSIRAWLILICSLYAETFQCIIAASGSVSIQPKSYRFLKKLG